MKTATLCPSPMFPGRRPSVPVSVTYDAWGQAEGMYAFDSCIPDFSDVAQTQPGMDSIVARWLWYMHWDEFAKDMNAPQCPVNPEDHIWVCQWPEGVAL
jgi:hypothetical protein